MGGGGGSAPQINTGQLQNQQTSTNLQTAVGQANLNNVNQVTPYGSLTYSQTGTTDLGNGASVPNYTATQTLTPAQQDILNKTNNLQSGALDTASTALGNVNNSINNPINYAGAPAMPGDQTQAKNDAYNALTARSTQDLNTQQTQQATQLANQGIAPGTNAYNLAMQPIERARVDASNQGTINAGTIAGQNIDQAQTLRNQYIGEQTAQHNQPIQDLTALLGFGGQATNPSLTNTPQTQVNPTDTYAPALANYQGQIQQYQTQQANNQSTLGGIAGLGGSILGGLSRNPALFMGA